MMILKAERERERGRGNMEKDREILFVPFSGCWFCVRFLVEKTKKQKI